MGSKIGPKLVPFLGLFLDHSLQILRIPGVARRSTLSEEVPRAASRAVLLTNYQASKDQYHLPSIERI